MSKIVLCYKIGNFLKKPQGSREEFSFDTDFVADPKDAAVVTKHIIGDVQLLKLPHEINVQLSNVKVAVTAQCSRCIKNFSFVLSIPFTEREFIIDLEPRQMTKDEDSFYINLMTNELVLDEMVRQEIFLHFPYNPLCSESCLGLCMSCGVNLNERECGCISITDTKKNFLYG